jgi:hypothetical protein
VKLYVSPGAIVNAPFVQTRTERSDTEIFACAPFGASEPLPAICIMVLGVVSAVDVFDVNATGRVAQTGLGSMANGPTANIAMNNLRRDNLTDDFFILT